MLVVTVLRSGTCDRFCAQAMLAPIPQAAHNSPVDRWVPTQTPAKHGIDTRLQISFQHALKPSWALEPIKSPPAKINNELNNSGWPPLPPCTAPSGSGHAQLQGLCAKSNSKHLHGCHQQGAISSNASCPKPKGYRVTET